ncbi:S1C family serine protease [Allocatelliglobosispora scoriae]|nr:trypsin-like peptidase domain-containing protein [Allocatelliglobosispora scoriae]
MQSSGNERDGAHWWSDAANDPWRDPESPATMYAVPAAPGQPAPEQLPGPAYPRKRLVALVALAGVMTLTAGALGAAIGIGLSSPAEQRENLLGATHMAPAIAQRAPDSYAAVIGRVLPSVVTVRVPVAGGTALGSGFVVSKDGYVITNDHVVSGGSNVTVLFNDGSTAPAKVVGTDPESDVAVIKVSADGLTPVQLGDSDQVAVGDPVLAIGSPLALTSTVTSGIVSALDRTLVAGDAGQQRYYAAIQTDAAINHGNSGGPLLNSGGEVIGINSVIKSLATDDASSGNIGLAFAIPINQAKRVAEEIIKTGHARRTVIGARLEDSHKGVRLATVDPAGPAAGAGLRGGDVVVTIDGHQLAESADLIAMVRKYAPGTAVTVEFLRGSDRQRVTVTLVADAK